MKNEFKQLVDRDLSGLDWDERRKQRVLHALTPEGEIIMKKKRYLFPILALLLVLTTAGALAAGLVFSPQYDAVRLANEALEARYGITPEMLTVLYRDTASDAGDNVIVYKSVEAQWAEQIGVYTVIVSGKTAQAVWSHDGKDTSGGFDAKAWGAEQIGMICSDYAAACAATLTNVAPIPMPDPAEIAANQKKREEEAAKALSMAKITLADARALALDAIVEVYKLTDAQAALLKTTDEEYDTYYGMENGEPAVTIFYRMQQGDGVYIATIHVETGVILDVLYDSGLAGNG